AAERLDARVPALVLQRLLERVGLEVGVLLQPARGLHDLERIRRRHQRLAQEPVRVERDRRHQLLELLRRNGRLRRVLALRVLPLGRGLLRRLLRVLRLGGLRLGILRLLVLLRRDRLLRGSERQPQVGDQQGDGVHCWRLPGPPHDSRRQARSGWARGRYCTSPRASGFESRRALAEQHPVHRARLPAIHERFRRMLVRVRAVLRSKVRQVRLEVAGKAQGPCAGPGEGFGIVKAIAYFLMTILAAVAWITLLLAGILVDSQPLRVQLAKLLGDSPLDHLFPTLESLGAVIATYTYTNVILLAMLASYLGSVAATVNIGPDSVAPAADATYPRTSALLRRFLIALALLPGRL